MDLLVHLENQGIMGEKELMGRWGPLEILDLWEIVLLVHQVTGGVQDLLV